MKTYKSQVSVLLIILLFIPLIFSGWKVNKQSKISEEKDSNTSTNSTVKYITAKKAFELVLKRGKQWANDSMFVELDNFAGTKRTDGKTDIWIVEFYSKEKNKILEISVIDGGKKITTRETPMYSKQKEIKNGWMDSDKAMKIALEAYGKNDFEDCWMGLANGKKAPEWNIKFRRKDKKPFWVYIDAITGKVIDTRIGY